MGVYERIKELCDREGIAVTALESELGYGRGYIGKMRTTKKVPADRLQTIADRFGVTTEYLLTGEKSDGYYINPETAKAAQEILENKELSILFDAARDASPEDLRAVHAMLLALKRKEQHDE